MDEITCASMHRATATVALLSALLYGCPDPNTYGTPRTLDPGDLQVQVSASGFVGVASGSAGVTANVPSIGIRAGVVDRLDVGARLVGMTGLGTDAKWNFHRGRLDAAIDPMAQAFYGLPAAGYIPDIVTLHFHVPLLLGINFDEATTLVLTPGFVATVATASPESRATGIGPPAIAFGSSGVGARFGLGLNIHVSDTSNIQPEVTAWREFNDAASWVCVFGLGLSIGAQPNYSDLVPHE